MEYKVNEAIFEGYSIPSEAELQQFQTKYQSLTNEISHVPDKNMADFLFTSYVYLLKAKAIGDNRITHKETNAIKRFCRDYMNTYDLKDNLLYDMAFGLNKYHKEQWDGYLSSGRMKHIVKSGRSLETRISSSIDYNDLLNSLPIKYAYDVMTDKSECYWIRLQAMKFIEDFTVNQFKPDFEFYFNADVLRVIEIFLRLVNLATAKDVTLIGDSIINHVKPFQYFMLMNVFAWRKKDDFAENRYRKFVLFIPRKNGKSWLVAVVKMLGLILLPNESELFSASNTREQAMQIRKEFENICGASPAISRYFKINRDVIQTLHSNSEFKVLAGKPKDGSLPSIAAIDENGDAEVDNPVASSLEKGMSGSFQLLFYVSTAYEKYPSGMSVEVETAKSSLAPESDYLDQRLFAMLYTAQEPNLEWTSHEALKATNPLMWYTNRDQLISDQKTAIEQEHKRNAFQTRRLNIFLATNAGTSIAPIENLKACYRATPDFNWHGRQCILGLDLSLGDDNSAINLVTHDNGKYHVKQWAFVPEGRLDEKKATEKIDYRNWIMQKQVFATVDGSSNSKMINYKTIEDFIISLPKKYGVDITHIAYDHYNAGNLVQNLQDKELFYNTEFKIIQQNKTGRHFGISLLRQAVMQNRLFFDNSMMIHEWGAVQMKQTDNLYYVEKVKTAKNKTDMVYSLINALDVCNELYEVNRPDVAEDLVFGL
ncbi:phage terminase large subunit-like protein [Neobacillus niacini]|uniref:terminase TerL endonuclease subunit n=1 Tax=Neobacillus niacini TaxID=86668 RepID=UPI0027807DEA|nr:terminase TerL endonuclease subunit [Neobacillus niacini]MDQ0999776.1 phage terminase large subunit-like protein [Neobacillus niacini]